MLSKFDRGSQIGELSPEHTKGAQNESPEVKIRKSKWGIFWNILLISWVCGYFIFIRPIEMIEFMVFTIPLFFLILIVAKYGRW